MVIALPSQRWIGDRHYINSIVERTSDGADEGGSGFTFGLSIPGRRDINVDRYQTRAALGKRRYDLSHLAPR